MNEPVDNQPKRTYQWPWFVLAGVVLFLGLTVGFVSCKAKQLKQERDFSAPLPGSSTR